MVKVSVIIPTRNRPGPLSRALSSIGIQKGQIPLECIVVDDGDPGGSERVRELTRANQGVYRSTGGNRGGGHARNLGIGQATGELVAFLDDDDAWEEEKIRCQVAHMADQSIVMSYTGRTIVNGRRQRYSFRTPKYDDQYRSIMRNNFIGTTSTVMVRRDALREVGGFDSALPALQDYDLYIRLLRHFRTGWLAAPLTIYYDEDAGDKVSTRRDHFCTAKKVLSAKYRDDPFFPLLRRSFHSITLLKCVRSRRFLADSLLSLVKRPV